MAGNAGRRRAEPSTKSSSPLVALGGVFGGAVLAAAAWFFLVRAAIDFGSDAKNGQTAGWIFMALATLGAIACLALMLVLASRGLTAVGLAGAKSAPTGRRALHK